MGELAVVAKGSGMNEGTMPAWTVTGQLETTDMGPDGRFTAGVVVTFRTAAGLTGTVFVPKDAYTATNVREAIAARAAVMAEVGELQG